LLETFPVEAWCSFWNNWTHQLGFLELTWELHIMISPYIYARFRWYNMNNTKRFHKCITIIWMKTLWYTIHISQDMVIACALIR
jgi:hypothetical protein